MNKLFFTLITVAFCTYLQAQSPLITSFSPTSGSVGSLVTITGTNLSNPTSIIIGGISALPISNTGTSLVAMVMPGAITGRVKITTANGSDSTNNNFTVVVSSPPNTQQGSKLIGTGGVRSNYIYQGESVAISADGNTAIVGGSQDNGNQGAVWVYIRTGNVWTQQGNKLVGTGNTGPANQGGSVAISADGNTAIVGAAHDNTNIGAAWIFTRSNNIWTQQGNKLVGTGGVGAYQNQGNSVTISADGNTAFIGGIGDNNNQGAVWVFTRSGGIWTQQGTKLVGTGAIGNAGQGYSVSLNANGNTAIVGGYADNAFKGAAWIYVKTGNVWTQQGNKLVGLGTVGNPQQGCSVAISADGNTAIIGGYHDDEAGGAAWVYTRSGVTWSQQGTKFVGASSTGDAAFGTAVSLSADGNTAMISGYYDNGGEGSVWIYKRTANIWTQQGNKLRGTGVVFGGAFQGFSLSLSADGNTSIFGGIRDSIWQGAAWIFVSSSTVPVNITDLKAHQKNTGIQVEWNTQNELNLNSYEVEKSANANNFSKAGTVAATGLSIYNWFDASPVNGNNYYRLKMMDKDGSFKYSSIVNVKIGGIKNVFTVAGNPIKNNTLVLQLENVDKGNYALNIYNNLGQQMISKIINHEGGSATQTLYLGTISAGAYQLNIIGNNIKVNKTIVVE